MSSEEQQAVHAVTSFDRAQWCRPIAGSPGERTQVRMLALVVHHRVAAKMLRNSMADILIAAG